MRPPYFSDEFKELFRNGEFSRVVARCNEILCIQRKSSECPESDIANVLDDRAKAHFEMGDFPASIDTLKEVLRLDSGKPAAVADCVCSLANLGLLYHLTDRPVESQLALERAKELVPSLPVDQQWIRSTVLVNMARLRIAVRDYVQAERLLVEAAKQRQQDFGSDHPQFARVFVHLSNLYLGMDKALAAERALGKAIRIYREASHTEGADFAWALTLFGHLRAERGLPQEAKDSYTQALAILQRIRPSHPRAIEIQERLSKLDLA